MLVHSYFTATISLRFIVIMSYIDLDKCLCMLGKGDVANECSWFVRIHGTCSIKLNALETAFA